MAGPSIEELMRKGGRVVEEEDDGPSDDVYGYDALPPYQEPEPLMSYSPEAAIRAAKAAEIPDVGPGETFIRHAVSAIPLGKLATNVLATGALRALRPTSGNARLTPEAEAELRAMGEDVSYEVPQPPILDDYRDIRDTGSERQDVGGDLNPWAARTGTGLGIGLSAAAPLPGVRVPRVPRAAAGAGLAARVAANPAAQRVASGVATGAVYGTLGGATDGPADLTQGDVSGTIRDALQGGAMGAAWGAGGAAVGEGARLAAPWLRKYAVRKTRENIQGDSDTMAVTRVPLRDESAATMLDEGLVRPFNNTLDTYERILPATEAERIKLGTIITKLEERGFKGPEAEAVALKLMERYDDVFNNSGSNKGPANVFKEEAENIRLLAKTRGDGGRLGLRQGERIKRDVQDEGNFSKRQPTRNEDSLREASSIVRQSVEDTILEQAKGRGRGDKIIANRFKPQKQRLGSFEDALQHSERGAAKFQQKNRTGIRDDIFASGVSDTILGSKLLASLNAQARSRGASAMAVGANNAQRFLTSPGAPEALGRGAAEAAPLAAREVERRVDDETLEKVARATPEQLGEYAGPIQAAIAQGKDRLRAVDKVLRDTDPKYRQMREHLGTAYVPD